MCVDVVFVVGGVGGSKSALTLSTKSNTKGLLNLRYFARVSPSVGIEAAIARTAVFGQEWTRWESDSEGPSSPSWRWRGTTLTTGANFEGHLLTCCCDLPTALQCGQVTVFFGGSGVEDDLLLGAAVVAGASSRVLPLFQAACVCTSQAGYGTSP